MNTQKGNYQFDKITSKIMSIYNIVKHNNNFYKRIQKIQNKQQKNAKTKNRFVKLVSKVREWRNRIHPREHE